MSLHLPFGFGADVPVLERGPGGRLRRLRIPARLGSLPPVAPAPPFPSPFPPPLALRGIRFRRRLDRLFGGGENRFTLLVFLDEIGNVEEGVLFEPDVDEGRLHPGENLGHPPLVGIGEDAPVAVPFNIEFGQLVVFQDGDSRFQSGAGNDHVLDHGCAPVSGTQAQSILTGKNPCGSERAGPCEPQALQTMETMEKQKQTRLFGKPGDRRVHPRRQGRRRWARLSVSALPRLATRLHAASRFPNTPVSLISALSIEQRLVILVMALAGPDNSFQHPFIMAAPPVSGGPRSPGGWHSTLHGNGRPGRMQAIVPGGGFS